MRTKLKLLADLQDVDLKIDGLQGEKDRLLEEMAELDRKVAEAESEIAAKQGELQLVEDEKAGLEESLARETENISRSETNLREIKTQKEYQAVSKEISTAKKLKGELEEQVLAKIGQIEELKSEITVREENLRQLGENTAVARGEIQEKLDGLEGGRTALAAEREETAKGLPAPYLRRYTLLREQRRGIAVVEARDGSCFGCNMNLPPQLYNSLFRADDLITCPHCQRMLVLKQEQ